MVEQLIHNQEIVGSTPIPATNFRSVAKPGIALALGAKDRGFKFHHSDQKISDIRGIMCQEKSRGYQNKWRNRMKTFLGMVTLVVLFAMVQGCATGPFSPMKAGSLSGSKVIYFEQSDRVPRTVLLAPYERFKNPTNADAAVKAIDPAAVAALFDKMLSVYPEVVKAYGNERTENALIGRRMLFRGYEGADLGEIEKIIRSMGSSIENWTPQFGKNVRNDVIQTK